MREVKYSKYKREKVDSELLRRIKLGIEFHSVEPQYEKLALHISSVTNGGRSTITFSRDSREFRLVPEICVNFGYKAGILVSTQYCVQHDCTGKVTEGYDTKARYK